MKYKVPLMHQTYKLLIIIIFAILSICGYSQSIDMTDNDFVDDTLNYQQHNQNLRELVVSSSLIKHEPTKDVITITNNMRCGTVRMIDMLARVPGLSVNPITQKVDIDNYQDVTIFLDGNPVSADYVKSINPKRIARVEIIRVPSGQFAGLEIALNIVLKNDFEGWDIDAQGEGRVNLANQFSNYKKGLINATLSSKKVNFYAQLFGDKDKRYTSLSYQRIIFGDEYETMEPSARRPNKQTDGHDAQFFVGADYKIRANQTITTQLYYSLANSSERTCFEFMRSPCELDLNKNRSRDAALNMMYNGRFSDKWHVYALAQYDRYSNQTDYSLTVGDEETSATVTEGSKDFVNFNGIVSYQLTGKISLRLSENYTYRYYDSRDRENGQRLLTSRESRNNIEVNWIWAPSRRFSAVLSGALLSVSTQNDSKGDLRSLKVSSIQPLATIFWNFVKNFNARGQFNYVHGYPTLDMLSPAIYMVGPKFYKTGNADLNYTSANQLVGTVAYKSLISIHYFYSHQRNAIYFGYEPYGEDEIIGRYLNCGKTSHSLSLSANYNVNQNIRVEFTGTYSRNKVSSYGTNRSETGNSYSIFGNAVYNLSPLSTTLFVEYDFAWNQNPYLMGMFKYYNQKINVGLRRSFWQQKLSLTLTYQIPIKAYRYNESIETCENFYYRILTDNRVNNSQLMLRASFTIGNQKSSRMGNAFELESEK